jgi:hypothetical protein
VEEEAVDLMAGGSRERNRERERDQGPRTRYITFKGTPPVTYFLQLSTTSQNSTNWWGPNLQTHDPDVDIS